MRQELHTGIAVYYLIGTLFLIILISAIVFYVFLHQKKVSAFRFQLQQEEIKKQEAIFAALEVGEEKERTRIAEELHDGISTKLAGLNMNLDYLKSNILLNENQGLIEKTFNGISDAINELRDISHNLQPNSWDEKNLQLALQNYIEQLNSKNECCYNMFFEASAEEINRSIKLHGYRIITELLYNVHKHAKATIASVQIIVEDNAILQIIVEDNGQGFQPTLDTTSGIGLTNIRNRVRACNGIINIDSSAKGTTTIIEIPLDTKI